MGNIFNSDYEVRLATLGAMGGDITKRYDSVYEIDIELLKISANFKGQLDDLEERVEALEPEPEPQPNNEIWYTTTDGEIIEPDMTNEPASTPEIVSNTYTDGKGVIVFSGDLTSIGNGVCSGLNNLLTINLPNSITLIDEIAFSYCGSLTSITLPSGLTYIGMGAFSDCDSLTDVVIPSGTQQIDDGAFGYCNSLASVTIPSSATYIGQGVFRNCINLTSITYTGTISELNIDENYDEWFDGCPATVVHCSDGDATIPSE